MSDDSKYPSQLAERFQIRMPDGLRDRIREAAEKNNRSMNAEIIHRLEDGLVLAEQNMTLKNELLNCREKITRLETSLNSSNSATIEPPDAAQLEAMVESAAKAAAKEAAKEVAELLRGRLEGLDIKVQRGIDGRIKNRDTELKRRKGE
ncbi:Arc family DNA-binding protein [Bacillus subtilis]|uniref:Arc family DNA-binding protein n=1 Tax=Pseudochrobactrum asaccharolyticum TaxID=354351 RepID=UPI001F01A9CE|nr:Arc family DNA-binding protein [Pseudochrobactrum asaccharolyticum]MCF7647312.1 Arc family DNA-binding protein [Pseudochrobactrum asaccharolyticum]MCF7673603.1 Arc family DNA-binding protein [Bacillus subtilis]